MKILKIFGIVAGLHLFALILIFANPGCTSTTKPPPEPADTIATAPAPSVAVPALTPAPAASAPTDLGTPMTPPPSSFNPDAPATYGSASASSGGVHFTPTRPNSAAASLLKPAPEPDVTPAASYTVKSGDSLWTISKRNHISVAELAAANSLRSSAVLHAGQKLIIPGKSTAGAKAARGTAAKATLNTMDAVASKAPEPAPAKPSGQELTHTVKEGETLGSIAHKYGVKVGDIAVRNNITNPAKVRAGTELVIPGWKATAKSGRGAGAAPSAANAEPAAPSESTPSAAPTDTEQAPAAPASSVPVIHLDDSTDNTNPLTPAPKQ